MLPAGTRLHRFHNVAYDPIHFDLGFGGRLSAPDASFGVLDLALSAAGAFAESFLRIPGATLIARDLMASKSYEKLSCRARWRRSNCTAQAQQHSAQRRS
jgi:hypothetical protein